MSSMNQRFPFSFLRRRPARGAAAPDPSPAAPVLPEYRPSWATPAEAPVLREQVAVLEAERALAALHGLDRDGTYAEDLQAELAAARAAYVGTAVVELAVLRAGLDGRPQG